MHPKLLQHKQRRSLSSLLLTLALGCAGSPEDTEPPGSPATKAQGLALPPGLAPSLAKDIQVGPDPYQNLHETGSWSGYVTPVAASSVVYFTASNQDLRERDIALWKTDGTPEGTRLVQDFSLGRNNAYIEQLAAVGDDVYLRTMAGGSSWLWKSDGTSDGTHQVRTAQGAVRGVAHIISCGGELFFIGNGPQDANLWKSDGTPEGTLPLTTTTSAWIERVDPVCANGRVFFVAVDDSGFGHALWRSDGTPEGTRRLRSVGYVFGDWNHGPSLVAVGSRVFLTTSGYEQAIWTSDGTPEGTFSLDSSDLEARPHMPTFLTVAGEAFYFLAFDSTSMWRPLLWKSDGTHKGTRVVMEVLEYWFPFIPMGDGIFQSTRDGLYLSDGTTEGAVFIKKLLPFLPSFYVRPPFALSQPVGAMLGNRLLLSASEIFNQQPTLWVSDGTAAGTLPLQAAQGQVLHWPVGFTRLGDRMVFWADDGFHGLEPWVTDGTPEGTRMLRDIFRADSSLPVSLTDMGGTLFFSAYDAEHGRELWKSDGTPEGTVLVKDIGPGHLGQGPQALTPVGETLFFFHERQSGNSTMSSLWKTDGTEAGTQMLRQNEGLSARRTGSLGTTLFFYAYDAEHGYELWKSDGTPEGTVLFKDINPGPQGTYHDFLTRVGETLFFSANDGVHGQELWKTDGTPEGTVLVKDVRLGAPGSYPSDPVNVGGTLFFIANDGVHGYELWKSDGTPEGTVLVADLSNWWFHNISGMVALEGTLFFVVNDDSVHGRELWKSDGTPEGTVRVTDLFPNPGSAFYSSQTFGPGPLYAIGESLYFMANDGVHGRELWKSDGTPEGTVRVADLHPGIQDSGSIGTSLVPVGPHGGFAFSATNGTSGMELWMSDGTPEGTRLLADMADGVRGSSPLHLTVSGPRLFFVAEDGEHGRELWSVKHAALKSR